MSPDLLLALELAEAADEISLGRFRATDLVVETKPDRTPVTEADRAVEEAIRSRLAAERPDDGMLGEEFGATGSGTRRWIVDPIDGTRNYSRGIPVWATLIALEENGEIQLGDEVGGEHDPVMAVYDKWLHVPILLSGVGS